MTKDIAIIGAGTTGFRATTPDLSFRELTYEAAKKAYLDAGVEPKDIGAFVATSEDFCEGYSITDEYSLDQLGAVLKPIYTVPGDFIQSMGSAVMMLKSGLYDTVAVQGLSKASNITLPSSPYSSTRSLRQGMMNESRPRGVSTSKNRSPYSQSTPYTRVTSCSQ